MYWVINVSDSKGHLFRTAKDSLTDENYYKRALAEIQKRFPAREGFKVCGTLWRCSGEPLNWVPGD